MSTSSPSRVLVVGAGAMGGYLAGQLARAGHPVAVVARGPHADRIVNHGLRVCGSDGSDEILRIEVYRSIREAPPADWLFITLKSHQVAAVIGELAPLACRSGLVIPVHNGVGWWYFQRGGPAEFQGKSVRAVDPEGEIAARMPIDRIVPMFAFKSAEVISPGVVRHIVSATDRWVMGELDARPSERLDALRRALALSGLRPECADPRATMWAKLLGNIYANPLCALSGLDLGSMVSHPEGYAMAIELMQECASVAAAYGVDIDVSFEDRIARSRAMGAARPSMLQDRLAHRPMENAAILGALIELGRHVGVEVTRTRTLHACLALLEHHEQATSTSPAAISSH